MKKLTIYKGRLSLYIILILCVGTLMFSLQKCSTSSIKTTTSYMRAGEDTINVAIEISPVSLSMSSDTIGGLYYDILNLIAKKYNVKFKFHKFVPLKFALESLENGLFDLVVANIPSTSELKEKFSLTEPIYIDHQVLVQNKNNVSGIVGITNHYQLASDSVWVIAGSPFIERISNLKDELGCDTIYIIESPEYSSEQLVILVALGEIKQAVVNAAVAKSIIKDYPQLDINTKISFNQFQVWALNRNNHELEEKINRWIIEVKKTEEYLKLVERYSITKK